MTDRLPTAPAMCANHEWLDFEGKPCPYCPAPPSLQEDGKLKQVASDCLNCGVEVYLGSDGLWHHATGSDRYCDFGGEQYSQVATPTPVVQEDGKPDAPSAKGGEYRPHYSKREADAYIGWHSRQLASANARIASLEAENERLKDDLFTQQDIDEAYANGKSAGLAELTGQEKKA
jgi:hypothetical protein